MIKFNEQDFSRLEKDKDFANEILLYYSDEMLRAAYNLYRKEPNKMNEIIGTIGYAVDKHLDTKEKFKVIHALSTEKSSGAVFGFRNLHSLGASKMLEFNSALDEMLNYIEIKEEGRLQERNEILHPKKKNIIAYDTLKGFQTSLTATELIVLYASLIKGRYIDKGTKLTNFIAVFSDSYLPKDFIPVKWILVNREQKPHKTALREFLTLALGVSPNKKTVRTCFTDGIGNEILLLKPRRIQPSNHYNDFEKLISS